MRRTMARHALASVVILIFVWTGACARTPAPPALITHAVYATLNDANDANELIRDCDALIAPIPGIASYACGRPFDSGRPQVDGEYAVGMVLGFASEAAYDAYLKHPNHLRILEKWRPRMESIQIRDVFDPGR